MIQIDRHIEVLLLDNDCVIVPDLGGFMAYHVPARYVKESGQFIPPSRQLGFNAQLKINDSLLAQSYIEAYDISYPEALRRIEAEVEEMRQLIQNTGMCELNDIGVLRVNEHGSMEFEPCEAGILTPSLYGLNTLDMMPLVHKVDVQKKPIINVAKPEHKEEKKDEIADTPIVPAPIHIVDKDELVDNTPDNDDAKRVRSTINVAMVKRVAAIAAVILSLFIIVVPFGSPAQKGMNRSYLDSGFLYNLFAEKPATPKVQVAPKQTMTPAPSKADVKEAKVVKEKAAEAKTEPKETKEDKQKTVEAKPAETKKTEAKKSGTYYAIVVASCIPHKSAAEMSTKLGKSGLNEAHVVDRSNGSKVVYGHYASESEARTALRNLRSKNSNFGKGWVMKFN